MVARQWYGCVASDPDMDPLIGLRTEEEVCDFMELNVDYNFNFFLVEVREVNPDGLLLPKEPGQVSNVPDDRGDGGTRRQAR